MHKAKAAAEQLPGALEALPGSANAALHAGGALAARAEGVGELARAQAQRAQRGLTSLAGLGGKLVLGTSDLFDKVRWVLGCVGMRASLLLHALGLPVLPAGLQGLPKYLLPCLCCRCCCCCCCRHAVLLQPCHPK
jgi:hypothetical protein